MDMKVRKTRYDEFIAVVCQGQGTVFFGKPGKRPRRFSFQANNIPSGKNFQAGTIFAVTDVSVDNEIIFTHETYLSTY
jgi:hypothetical protein